MKDDFIDEVVLNALTITKLKDIAKLLTNEDKRTWLYHQDFTQFY